MHKLEIIVTPSAEEDMQNIFDFIAQDNINKALEMIDIFENKFETLALFPKSGVIKSKFIVREVRCAVVAEHYQVIYFIKKNYLYIQRVLTGYQDIIF